MKTKAVASSAAAEVNNEGHSDTDDEEIMERDIHGLREKYASNGLYG